MAAKKKSKRKAKAKKRKRRVASKVPIGIAPTTGRPYPKLDVKRAPDGKWLKGSVPNPAGRGAQRPPLFEWMCEVAKEIDPETKLPYGRAIIRKLYRIALNATVKDTDSLRAIAEIFDRIQGKAVARIEADVRRSDWWAAIPDDRLRQIALGKMKPPEGMEDPEG